MKHFNKILFVSLLCSILIGQIKLDVSTIPKRVDVYLDGVNLGRSPILNERIKPGLHKFEIKKRGFAPLSYDLLVNPAQAIKLDFFLILFIKSNSKLRKKDLSLN